MAKTMMTRFAAVVVAALSAVAFAAKTENPRCDPLAVGTEATLDEAAESIATCPVEHVIVLDDDTIAYHGRGTRSTVSFPKVASWRNAVAVHNHPSGHTHFSQNDRCAALSLRRFYVVFPNGTVEEIMWSGDRARCVRKAIH